MKTRRFAGVVAAALVSATILMTGCAASTSHTSGTTGTLSFYNDKNTWKFAEFSQFSEKEIGVSLKSTAYADQNLYQAFIKRSLRTSASPGMFTWHTGDQLKTLVSDNIVADTSSIWKKAVASGSVSKSIENLYTVAGKQYCIPMSVDNWAMFYNKKVFAKYNLTAPTSWKELMGDAAVLKKNGVTPFWNQGGLWSFVWFQTLLAATDLKLYEDLADGKASYTNPGVVKVMNYWLELQKKGFFNNPSKKDLPETLLRDGTVAMVPNGIWFTANATAVGMSQGSDYDMFPIPTINTSNGATPVAIETTPACVPAASKQAALGLKFSAFWMSAGAQSQWSKLQANLPYNPQAQAATASLRALGKTYSAGKYVYYLRYYEATPTHILTEATDNFTSFLTNPGDPTPYLQKIQRIASEYWASNK